MIEGILTSAVCFKVSHFSDRVASTALEGKKVNNEKKVNSQPCFICILGSCETVMCNPACF